MMVKIEKFVQNSKNHFLDKIPGKMVNQIIFPKLS
jgi:hypothetical protein